MRGDRFRQARRIDSTGLPGRVVGGFVEGSVMTMSVEERGSKRAVQIAALEEKLRQLKAREQAIEARRRSLESRRQRKADTRRKILVGAIVLARVEQGRLPEAELRGWLDQALTREDDRALFGLE
jgi:hypothetical protein